MKIIKTDYGLIKSRCNNPEQWAIDQAIELTKLPFLHKYVALMPDTHQGYWMPIWWVLATKWVIIPNAVWVDIGCWMCAVKTSLRDIDIDVLKKILWDIRDRIPVWTNKHKEKQDEMLMPDNIKTFINWIVEKKDIYENALYQLWTLWGWNHFIEIQKGSDWYIYIMIHSWSRNLWKQVADYYNKKAIKLNQKRYSNVPKDLNFLPVDSKEWQDYIQEMQYCVDYAFANRKLMINRVQEVFKKNIENIEFDNIINIAHNYARLENHFWENVRVHRKWATSARDWEIWLIPWSQWTKSYIVKWKWNKESFMSCSHWAGRKMWRREAQRQLDIEQEKKKLDDMWVIHSIHNIKDLDEAPSAYKDIDIVMEEQKDLVDIVVELTPLAVVKG